MAIKYPYTDFHEMNLDWLLQQMKSLNERMDTFVAEVTADIMPLVYEAIEQGLIDVTYDSVNETVVLVPGAGVTSANLAKFFQINNYKYPVADAKAREDIIKMSAFVTPEMYGATGDGVADDTTAIQAAFDSGKNVVFHAKHYKTTATLILQNKDNISIFADGSFIEYTGNSYAIEIIHVTNSTLFLGDVSAIDGGCLLFECNSADNFTQYINIYFNQFTAKTNCVYMHHTAGWVNEVRLYNGRLRGIDENTYADFGIKIERNSTGDTNGWKLCELGFEGLSTCIGFVANAGSIGNCEITNCRYIESFTKLIESAGRVHDIMLTGSSKLRASMISVTNQATEWYLNTPVYDENNVFVSPEARIYVGRFIAKPINFIDILDNTDLNTYIAPYGKYRCYSGSTASTLTNAPTTKEFFMDIIPAAGWHNSSVVPARWSYWMRVAITHDCDIFIQSLKFENIDPKIPAFGPWMKINTTNV